MDIRKVFQDIVAPELRAIEGKFEALRSEIKRIDEKFNMFDQRMIEKMDVLRNEVKIHVQRLDSHLDTIDQELRLLHVEFNTAVKLHERLSALEAKINR